MITFEYYGAKICIEGENKNQVDARIFPNKDDYPFSRGVFSRAEYIEMLDSIKDKSRGARA